MFDGDLHVCYANTCQARAADLDQMPFTSPASPGVQGAQAVPAARRGPRAAVHAQQPAEAPKSRKSYGGHRRDATDLPVPAADPTLSPPGVQSARAVPAARGGPRAAVHAQQPAKAPNSRESCGGHRRDAGRHATPGAGLYAKVAGHITTAATQCVWRTCGWQHAVYECMSIHTM